MTQEEITNIIYDTLFGNTQYQQFDLEHTTPLSEYAEDDNYKTDIPTQEVDARKGIIRFGYDNSEFEIMVRRT